MIWFLAAPRDIARINWCGARSDRQGWFTNSVPFWACGSILGPFWVKRVSIWNMKARNSLVAADRFGTEPVTTWNAKSLRSCENLELASARVANMQANFWIPKGCNRSPAGAAVSGAVFLKESYGNSA